MAKTITIKPRKGLSFTGVLLFSERREFVDDDIKALRQCAGAKDAGVAGLSLIHI